MKLKNPTLPHFRDPKMLYLVGLMVLCFCAIATTAIISPHAGIQIQGSIFAVILLVLLTRFLMGVSLEETLRVGSVLAAFHITGETLQNNHIHSSTLVWVSLLPITYFHIHGQRAALRWTLVALGITVLAAVFGLWQGTAATTTVGIQQAPVSFSEYFLASLGILIVPWIYRKRYDETLDESKTRQRDLKAKQVELEHTQQMQEQFIALVSHELRTPMNAILGLNSVLLERVQGKPQASKVLEYTKQSAGHLMTVINDVLDYSQIHQGNITARVERFALHDTVRAAFELFLPQIESARLHYACEIDPGVPEWVETDRHRLMQVLVNLLGNAIKFTHHGHVRLKITAQQGGLAFAVEDTGIGIAPEKQARIFEGFSQADASIQGRYGGSGLGLTISLQLVQMLGGQLQLESQDGTGSRFWFSLPLEGVPAPDKPESRAHEQAGQVQRALRFLVADDHPVNRLLVRQVLSRQWPHSAVVEAEDGQAAVQALMQGPAFDLVLMDMVMPVMDGIEATRKIKASELRAVRSTPVLGLTANVSTTDLERFKAAGLGGLLLKPFDVAQLRAEVLRLMADRLQEEAVP